MIYLIPTTLSDDGPINIISNFNSKIIEKLRIFFVEEEKSARQFIRKISAQFPLQECQWYPLNEHTKPQEIKNYLALLASSDAGIISESGCPCVADPGTDLVLLAHQNNVEIIPLVGPSSILLALMASGLNGQNFAFNGYLPKEREERVKKIKQLEKRSLAEGQTQIFKETPYRNQNIFEDILSCCVLATQLCIAYDLTGAAQSIRTLSISEWKKSKFVFSKKPALFLIGSKILNS